jgi:hypothetical protein
MSMCAFILFDAVVGHAPLHVLNGYDDVAQNLAWQPLVHPAQKPGAFEYTRTQKPLLEMPHSHPQDACQVLANAGVRSIAYYGDSYLRHAYQATARLLTGNFRDAGAIKNASNVALEQEIIESPFTFPAYACDFDGAFLDPRCRSTILREIHVCNASVTLYLHETHRSGGC